MENRKYLLDLDLQLFSDGDPNEDGLIDFDDDKGDASDIDDEKVSGTEDDVDDEDIDFRKVLEGIRKEEDEDDEIDEDGADPDEIEKKEEDPAEPVIEDKPEEKKPTQSAEENARYAEQRRQKQLEAEIQKAKESDPAFQVAKQLADMYGVTPEQMLEQLKQQKLAEESKATGVPIERLKQEQEREARLKEAEAKIVELEFNDWNRRMDGEAKNLLTEFPMLTEDDIKESRVHMLQVLRRVDLPLEEAVYALHGKKIAQGIREAAKQEALAEMSGRKTIVPPATTGVKSNDTGLTADERYAAKMLGISEAEYKKYDTRRKE